MRSTAINLIVVVVVNAAHLFSRSLEFNYMPSSLLLALAFAVCLAN